MAITSLGYDGTIGEVQLAVWAPTIGTPPCRVAGPAPTIRTGAVGGIRIPPSVYSAWGITDTITANVDTATTVTSDAVRWDSVCLRRNWSTNTTSVFIVPGGPTMAPAPTGLLNSLGTGSADQVIALAKMVKGATDVQQLVPWAPWAHPALVWPGPTTPPASAYDEGTFLVRDDGEQLVRRMTGSPAAPSWESLTDTPWVDLNITGHGWEERALHPCRARLLNRVVYVEGAVVATEAYPNVACTAIPLANSAPDAPRILASHQASGGGPSYVVTVDSDRRIMIDRTEWVSGGKIVVGATYPIKGHYPISTVPR